MENNNKNKIIAIIVAAVAVIAIICIIAVSSGKKNDNKSALVPADGQSASETVDEGNASDSDNDSSSADESQPEEVVKVTPTFMYFISGNDQDFENTNAMIAELQVQYSEQVNFDIVNIDENPEAVDNFPVAGQTPVLIMLNTSNDISAIEFLCSDKSILEEDIKKALE